MHAFASARPSVGPYWSACAHDVRGDLAISAANVSGGNVVVSGRPPASEMTSGRARDRHQVAHRGGLHALRALGEQPGVALEVARRRAARAHARGFAAAGPGPLASRLSSCARGHATARLTHGLLPRPPPGRRASPPRSASARSCRCCSPARSPRPTSASTSTARTSRSSSTGRSCSPSLVIVASPLAFGGPALRGPSRAPAPAARDRGGRRRCDARRARGRGSIADGDHASAGGLVVGLACAALGFAAARGALRPRARAGSTREAARRACRVYGEGAACSRARRVDPLPAARDPRHRRPRLAARRRASARGREVRGTADPALAARGGPEEARPRGDRRDEARDARARRRDRPRAGAAAPHGARASTPTTAWPRSRR